MMSVKSEVEALLQQHFNPDELQVDGDECSGGVKLSVEETFGNYFGYLARCEGKFCTTTLNNQNLASKWDENADTDSAKI